MRVQTTARALILDAQCGRRRENRAGIRGSSLSLLQVRYVQRGGPRGVAHADGRHAREARSGREESDSRSKPSRWRCRVKMNGDTKPEKEESQRVSFVHWCALVSFLPLLLPGAWRVGRSVWSAATAGSVGARAPLQQTRSFPQRRCDTDQTRRPRRSERWTTRGTLTQASSHTGECATA